MPRIRHSGFPLRQIREIRGEKSCRKCLNLPHSGSKWILRVQNCVTKRSMLLSPSIPLPSSAPQQCYIYERRIFGTIFPLCFLCSLLFQIFGCGSRAAVLFTRIVHFRQSFPKPSSQITNYKFSMTNSQFRLSALVAAAALRPGVLALKSPRLAAWLRRQPDENLR